MLNRTEGLGLDLDAFWILAGGAIFYDVSWRRQDWRFWSGFGMCPGFDFVPVVGLVQVGHDIRA